MRLAVVGNGRLGNALASALADDISGDLVVQGPFGRGFTGEGFDIVVLAVPDGQIAAAVAAVVAGPLVGHCAGALGLDVLGDRESFAMHPLMTVTAEGATFTGAGAAIAGSSASALGVARQIAEALGMRPVEILDADRGAYHAAASMAANFLVTLEDAAAQLLATTGADRQLLVPLVSAAVDNWATLGGPRALTGPIARGDEATVAHQRATVAERTPQLIALFDALADATRALAARVDG
ncbi:MAG: hypothetical protein JWM34_1374 [Ilumatobacteraceae bacterium]|nr:hypothetical protein [Ilumatobacteraceae bacterium]